MTTLPEPSERPPEESARAEAEAAAVLRRIGRLMMLYGALGVVVLVVLLGGWREVPVLILATAGGIISFRGLQLLVGQIGARGGEKLDRRGRLLAGMCFGIILLLPVAVLWLDSRQTLALVVGFSAFPLALMTEGVSQFFRSSTPQRPKQSHGS